MARKSLTQSWMQNQNTWWKIYAYENRLQQTSHENIHQKCQSFLHLWEWDASIPSLLKKMSTISKCKPRERTLWLNEQADETHPKQSMCWGQIGPSANDNWNIYTWPMYCTNIINIHHVSLHQCSLNVCLIHWCLSYIVVVGKVSYVL